MFLNQIKRVDFFPLLLLGDVCLFVQVYSCLVLLWLTLYGG